MNPHMTYCQRYTNPMQFDRPCTCRHTAPTVEERLFTIRVTFRDGFTIDVPEADIDSVAVDNEGTARATLGIETFDNRIVRFPLVTVAFWEALCD